MGFLEDRDLSDVPSIPEYYKGKTLFITGGSGFMGKVLIEKLLYSCSDLDRIYLLLRPKKGLNPEERINELYKNPCFDRLRAEKPDIFKSKVFFIAGDCSKLGLGISEEDRALLVNRVHIIFHVAASVRFDEPLKVAAMLNLRGTREVMELAKWTQHLEAMVHVSTIYSNTNRDPIEEIMYPPLADWRETLDICNNFDDNTLHAITPKYLGEMPNTYVFTKQLAEHLVYECKGKLPIAIIRPSIVVSSVKEPMPGWIESFNGPVGISIACGKGILRYMYSNPDNVNDYIPVDIAIQNFITVAWLRGTKKLEIADDVPIYNCCTSNLIRLSIRESVEIGKRVIDETPLVEVIWTTGGKITTSRTLFYFAVIFLHIIPGILVDCLLRLFGRKPMLLKIQRRIYIANLAVEYYMIHQWTFINRNFLEIRSKIKDVDKEQFYYDIENINIVEQYKKTLPIVKKYLLKEKPEDQGKAMIQHKRLLILDWALKTIFYVFLIWKIFNSYYIQSIIRSM